MSVWAPTNPSTAPPAHVTLARLVVAVRALPAPPGIVQSLLPTLTRVRQELSRGDRRGVERHLDVFLNKLAALRGTILSGHLDALAGEADTLRAGL